MSLYIPRHFASEDRSESLALIASAPFATLVTVPADGGEAYITHLPLLLDGERLLGHMARANPHWQAFAGGRTTAVFHGPHAYLSPRWYLDPAVNVPTWNFTTVHVHGEPSLIEGAAEKLAVLDATSAAFEPAENPWTRQLSAAREQALLGAIVAFQLPLTRLDTKIKMSQNKTPQERAQVARLLRDSGDPLGAAVADVMNTVKSRDE